VGRAHLDCSRIPGSRRRQAAEDANARRMPDVHGKVKGTDFLFVLFLLSYAEDENLYCDSV
jgi:hypothetical protein